MSFSTVRKPKMTHMCGGLMGPAVWRNNSLREIDLSQTMVARSDKTTSFGQTFDPVPHFRDILCNLSNDEAYKYARQVRVVLHRLRQSIIDTNEELIALNNVIEQVEKLHEHIRKDIIVNLECQRKRTARPAREKCTDGPDDMLLAEHKHLTQLKEFVEDHLRILKAHIQVLNDAHRRLTVVVQERQRVLDLTNQAVPSVGGQSDYVNLINVKPSLRKQAYCSSNPNSVSSGVHSDDPLFRPDTLGPYTPECHFALEDGRIARERSERLRMESLCLRQKTRDMMRSFHEAVNKGLLQKIIETTNLKEHLDLAYRENCLGTNRAQRWYDLSETAWQHSRGPIALRDLQTREKLDRPNIKVIQRHPGQNMPDAQELVSTGDVLLSSLQTTGRNIGLLKMSREKIKEDLLDKRRAIRIDNSVLKYRRAHGNHRWEMRASSAYN